MKHQRQKRDGERGTIAIVVAALLTTLFGFAALAVDAGYLYTRSRTLQAVADASVTAGMPLLRTSPTNARAAATALANANGYTTGVTVTTPAVDGSELRVVITQNQPAFFRAIFGSATRPLNGRATGKLTGATAPALMALGGCALGVGITINGNSSLQINGSVQSNGRLQYQTGPTITRTTEAVNSPCAGYPASNGAWNEFPGGIGPGGPFTDPFSGIDATDFPACTFGSLAAPYTIPFGNWSAGGVLQPGVYCSGGDLNVSSPDPCMCIQSAGATFVATGRITIGADNPSEMTPFPGSPNNILVYTSFVGDCSVGPGVNLGNRDLTFNGSIYAPNACINAGGDNFEINGSFIGREVQLGLWGPWTINGSGGSGGTSWRMQY